jgi:hypothetical protein
MPSASSDSGPATASPASVPERRRILGLGPPSSGQVRPSSQGQTRPQGSAAVKAKQRRELDRQQHEGRDLTEAEMAWEIRAFKEEVRQEELRRRRERRDRDKEAP